MRLAASCEGGGAEEVRGEGEAVAALEAYDEANGGEVNGDVVDATPLAELLAGTRLGADPWPFGELIPPSPFARFPLPLGGHSRA